jgi:hypothetical protein
MIPEPKQPAVAHALHQVFGVNEFEDIQVVTGGLSRSSLGETGRRTALQWLRPQGHGDCPSSIDTPSAVEIALQWKDDAMHVSVVPGGRE